VRIALLALTVALLGAAAFLALRALRREAALDDLAALASVLGAGVPAAAYGALAA
jgi:hypothetical protein